MNICYTKGMEKESNIASFEERLAVESEHMERVQSFLYAREETVGIAEATLEEQKRLDVDFHWLRTMDDSLEQVKVEVKFDTQGHATGNFAFETVSNELRSSAGCILRSEADLLFYYFCESRELWVMGMREVREWFLEEMASTKNRFRSFETYTERDGLVYPSYGRLVPLVDLKNAGPKIGLKRAQL